MIPVAKPSRSSITTTRSCINDFVSIALRWSGCDNSVSMVPAGVLEGIEDIAEGRTADGDNLDKALDQ